MHIEKNKDDNIFFLQLLLKTKIPLKIKVKFFVLLKYQIIKNKIICKLKLS